MLWAPRDNASGSDPIGTLVIENGKISLGKLATYSVKAAGAFGEGRLFEVTGSNSRRDPQGCGPEGRGQYLAVEPLAPVMPPVGGAAIRVFFYSGRSPRPCGRSRMTSLFAQSARSVAEVRARSGKAINHGQQGFFGATLWSQPTPAGGPKVFVSKLSSTAHCPCSAPQLAGSSRCDIYEIASADVRFANFIGRAG
jgi:hypothetical protein